MPETTQPIGAPAPVAPTSPVDTNRQVPEPSRSNIFSRTQTDLSFLDPQPDPQNDQAPSGAINESTEETSDPNKVLAELFNETPDEDVTTAPEKTSPTAPAKHSLTDFFRKQVEAGRIVPFDDFDEQKQSLEQYLQGLSSKDLYELWEANQSAHEKQSYEQISNNFFASLPQELQYAYQYVANGGTDLKELFRSLSHIQETRELDVEKPEDQEAIYQQYLTAIQFGTPEEIAEEINTWKDLGQLDKKAKQAKPKLDKIREAEVSRRLEEQESQRQKNEQAAQAYVQNVYQALQPGEINGLRLDKKTQSFLYNSMVNADYVSITGKPTNLLGHLLEKYQFVEPNYPLISEALWLLSDPTGYRAKLIEAGASKEAARTVRALKSEEGRKQAGQSDTNAFSTPPASKKIPRPGNIFRR